MDDGVDCMEGSRADESFEAFSWPTVNPSDIAPYQFEPSESEDNSDSASGDSDDENPEFRLRTTNWCSCGNCVVMPTITECVCCQEIQKVLEKLSQFHDDHDPVQCITMHPGFQDVCLRPYVLETAYLQYKQEYGERQHSIEEQRRYTSYRQLVRWCWGYLGRDIRVPLPACAVNVIRETFPSDVYKGFNFP